MIRSLTCKHQIQHVMIRSMVCKLLNWHVTICPYTYKGLFHHVFLSSIRSCGRVRLVVMNRCTNQWMNMWISTLTKNFEMSHIHLSWFMLHGCDGGGVVLMIRGLKKLVWCSVRWWWGWWGCRLSWCIESTYHRLFQCMSQGTQSWATHQIIIWTWCKIPKMLTLCICSSIAIISPVIAWATYLYHLTHFVNAVIVKVKLPRYDVVTIFRSSGLFLVTRATFCTQRTIQQTSCIPGDSPNSPFHNSIKARKIIII